MNQKLNDLFTCEICSNILNEPKTLPCQHTFCSKPCLISLIDYRYRNIKCPKCSKVHAIPNNGVDGYPVDKKFYDYIDKINSIVKNHEACFECQNRENLLKCMDCSNFYCNDCSKLHLTELKEVFKKQFYDFKKITSVYMEKVGNYLNFRFSQLLS
jgi:hypothetical protein